MTVRVYNPRGLRRGDRVSVLCLGVYLRGEVDAPPQCGWVGVAGLRGRAGVASVRVSSVRMERTT